MTTTVVVHEDGNPFVRIERFTSKDSLFVMMQRTHKSLMRRGYMLSRTREKEEQRVLTYKYVRTLDDRMKDIHVVVVDG